MSKTFLWPRYKENRHIATKECKNSDGFGVRSCIIHKIHFANKVLPLWLNASNAYSRYTANSFVERNKENVLTMLRSA